MLVTSFRARLLLSYGVLLVLLVATGVAGLNNVNSVSHGVTAVYEQLQVGLSAVEEARLALKEMGTASRDASLAADKETVEGSISRWEKARTAFLANLDQLEAQVTTQEGKSAVSKARDTWQKDSYLYDLLFSITRRSDFTSQLQMMPELRSLIVHIQTNDRSVGEAMDAVVAVLHDEKRAATVLSERQLSQARDQMTLILLFGAVVAASISLLLSRSITGALGWLGSAAESLARGEVEQTTLRSAGKDEIGRVVASFQRMMGYFREMASAAEAISRGDLTHRVEPRSDKDVLGHAFERMISNLREMTEDVSSSASTLASAGVQLSGSSEQAGSATAQIAATIGEVARGTQEQAGAVQRALASIEDLLRSIGQMTRGTQQQANSIERVSSSVAQLNRSVFQVAGSAKEVSSAAEQARSAASSGGETVKKSAAGMAAIRDASRVVEAQVQELGNYSSHIGTIVETIDDLAAQTNLLALNAAIEAARAGEHGRGFAVVADEVRKLAERSSLSAREIGGLIVQVQDRTREAVRAMQTSSAEVEAGTKLAEEAAEMLASIISAVQVAADQASAIASAAAQMESASRDVVELMGGVSALVAESSRFTEEMEAASGQVRSAMEKVAAVTAETSASAEEVSASAQEMSAQVQQVVALAQSLGKMADDLRASAGRFSTAEASEAGGSGEVVMRRRKDDWGTPERAAEPRLQALGAPVA